MQQVKLQHDYGQHDIITVDAMFGSVIVFAATSMMCMNADIIDSMPVATAGPGNGNIGYCAAFAYCVHCLVTAQGLSCSVCCAALLAYDYVAVCWQILTMMCTCYWTQNGCTSGFERVTC